MAHEKIDDSTAYPVYLGFIPEKAARLTVVLLLLLTIATYVFGVEVLFKILFALVVCWLSGLFWILVALVLTWLCVGSVKLNELLEKHDSKTKVASVFLVVSLIGGALSIYLFKLN